MMINIITNGLLLTPEVVDRLTPLGLNGVKVTLDGDRDTHNRMRPLRGGQGTFDRILDNVRQVAGKTPDLDRRQLRRAERRQLPGAARLPARAGVRRSAGQGRVQANHQAGAVRPSERHVRTDRGRRGREAARRRVHDVGRDRRLERLRQLQLPRREDVVFARGNDAARVSDDGRRAHGAVRDPQASRAHHRARTVRSTPARGSPAKRRSRPATSTARDDSGGASRPGASR